MSLDATKLFRLYVTDYIANTDGVTRSSLGKKAGFSDSYLRSMLKTGSQSPKLDTAEKIANAMGVSLVDIISPEVSGDSTQQLLSFFTRLDDRGRVRVLAGMKAEIEHLSSEKGTE
jgi:transcriptional regulator with XRE-family HTH domain